MYKATLILLAFGLANCHSPRIPANDADPEGLVKAFLTVPFEARTISAANQLEVNNEGGHLQGVQLIARNGVEYAMLSGSSSTYSYYAVARLGASREVIGVHRLLDKPFKHAGGFQIADGLMAIGVEDNDAKDRSKVLVFRLDDPESPPAAPLAVIERRGESKRATAGCVALARLGDRLLLIVGDWDSKHLDFYFASPLSASQDSLSFQKSYTIDTEQIDRSDWSDPDWLSYQNINLVKDDQDGLFLIGMTSNGAGQDVADLYELISQDGAAFRLKKRASRKFSEKEKTKFRWGAGVDLAPDGTLRIIACGEHLEKEGLLTIY